MSEQTSRCVIGKPHAAHVGNLCDHHADRLAAALRDIEEQAALLSPMPSMQQRLGTGRGSLPSERAPALLDVLVHTDRRRGTGRSETDEDELAAGDTLPILDVLGSWARLVREERDLAPPGSVTITGERDLLSRHLPWITAQPWVDELYLELRDLAAQLRTANRTAPDRPHCHCPVLVAGRQCEGSVWIRDELQPVWRRYTDRCVRAWEQAPGAAVCDTCGATWITDGDKARLKRMVEDRAAELARPYTEDGRPMQTAEDLARSLGVTVNAVYIRLHRAGARAVNGHYDPSLLRTDVAS